MSTNLHELDAFLVVADGHDDVKDVVELVQLEVKALRDTSQRFVEVGTLATVQCLYSVDPHSLRTKTTTR